MPQFKLLIQDKELIKSHLLPLLSSGLLILASPPFEQGFLAWFALLPLFLACLDCKPGQAFRRGYLFALPLTLYLNYYLTEVLFTYLPLAMALLAMISLVLYISLYYGLFALIASHIYRCQKPWFTVLAIPAAWLSVEYARSLTFLAYNVGYIGYTQWQYPAILNLTATYGYWGLPFLMVFSQVIIFLTWRKQLRGWLLGRTALFFSLLILGGLLLPQIFAATAPEGEINGQLQVALIQGNIDPQEIMDRGKENVTNSYLQQTETVLATAGQIDLVVWPETVASVNLDLHPGHPSALQHFSESNDLYLLYGAQTRHQNQLFNSITLVSPEGDEPVFYHKQKLVPFVEFFPAEKLLNRILQLDLLLGSYSFGEEIPLFKINQIPVGGVICFESYFGDQMRIPAAKGARHLFILTNDAWFAETIGLELHAQAAAIRAAETGRGVTQVGNSGITISFDYRGRELFRTEKNQESHIIASLDLHSRPTPYLRLGDYFAGVWLIFLVAGFAILRFQQSKSGPS